MENFEQLTEPSWKLLDAARSIESIQKDIEDIVMSCVKEKRSRVIGKLWT